MVTWSRNDIFKPKAYVSSKPAYVEPSIDDEALAYPGWKAAMQGENNALLNNTTWRLEPFDDSMHVISNKWVYRIKRKSDGSVERYKARLVARGFEQQAGVDFLDTFSPVIKPITVILVMSLVVTHSWPIQHIDVNNAFLKGHLKEIIYMKQPYSFVDPKFPTQVCRLIRSIYGMRQAPRAWFDRLKKYLVDWGFTRSPFDHSLFIYKMKTHLLLVLVYVDDILVTGGDSDLISKLIVDLDMEFSLKTLGEVSYFLGIEVHRSVAGITLHQSKYIRDLLHRTNLMDCKPCCSPISRDVNPVRNTRVDPNNPS